MIRSIVVLVALGAFIGSNAMFVQGPTCDVGEQERVGGLCNNGASQCNDYCRRKYGGELLGAVCASRPGKRQSECVCKLKCCNIGCWGDPHCWTCDGVRFGYQGLKKHILMKPIRSYPTMPEFEIRQTNKPWKGGPMSMLDISEILIKTWSLVIELKMPEGPASYVLKVNNRPQNIPYRFSQFDDYRERFVNIVYADASKSIVVLTTSFGLRITWTTKPRAVVESDISIDFPRHPELKDNSHGLLGRWNGNPDDDAIGSAGTKHPLDDKFSWAFGDSWIVLDGRTKTPDCVRNDAKQKNEQKFKDIDPALKAKAERMCRRALESPDLKDCAQKIGRVVPLIKNCVTDLIYSSNDAEREEYIADLVDGFLKRCQGKQLGEGEGIGLAI